MNATLVEMYTVNNHLYKLDAPLDFWRQNTEIMCNYDKKETDHVVICQVMVGMQPRTVIHAADQLAGGDGVSYGGGFMRIYDSLLSHEDALKLNGYALVQ